MSTPPIQFGGLASGLDTQTIIAQLMAVERQPRQDIVNKQSQAQARQSALQDVYGRLQTLNGLAADLKSPASWAPIQTVDTADATKVAASMTGGAAPGGYTIAVTQLASAAQATYGWTPGGTSIDVNGASIAVDAAATVDDVATAINGSADMSVFAVNVNGSLVLSSRTTGSAQSIALKVDGVAQTATSTTAGQNAKYSVNGVAQADSQSNVISAGVPGVQLTLKGITAGTTVSVSNPGLDKTALTAKIKSFVDAYNAAVDDMHSYVQDKRVVNPQSAADYLHGMLFNDQGLNAVLNGMRTTLTQSLATNPAGLQTLDTIGISTGATTGSNPYSQDAVAGKLTLDTSKLSAALDKDPLSVRALMGGTSGVNGFAQSFTAMMDPYVSATGTMQGRIDSAKGELKDLSDQLTRMDDRLQSKQDLLQKQFTALELALQKNQSMGAGLTNSLGGLLQQQR
jgi:flagellar hook-associated protein 2